MGIFRVDLDMIKINIALISKGESWVWSFYVLWLKLKSVWERFILKKCEFVYESILFYSCTIMLLRFDDFDMSLNLTQVQYIQ